MLPIALFLAALASPVHANGQTSHQWITVNAAQHVTTPALAAFLAREDARDALLNGTMFPDGGYAVGDGYGESSHWEPMQDLYLDWIRARCQMPYEGDCVQHVAFLLGMRSHGIADQFYDAVYMEQSRVADASVGWAAGESMDEATDVALVGEVGPGVVPPPFVPYQPLLQLLAEAGNPVEADLLDQAQDLLGIAIAYVGAAGENETALARYTAEFPWACAHQIDPETQGNPPHEAEVVARYWDVTWDRLQGGEGWAQPVIATYPGRPADGLPSADAPAHGFPAEGHPLVATDVRSRLQVVFARGLDRESVTPERFVVRDPAGVEVPVAVNLFYGTGSHVVNVTPLVDWSPDTAYTVTVAPGVATFDGLALEWPVTFAFTTAPRATEDPDVQVAPAEETGCGCATGATRSPALLLGMGVLAAVLRRRATGRG